MSIDDIGADVVEGDVHHAIAVFDVEAPVAVGFFFQNGEDLVETRVCQTVVLLVGQCRWVVGVWQSRQIARRIGKLAETESWASRRLW